MAYAGLDTRPTPGVHPLRPKSSVKPRAQRSPLQGEQRSEARSAQPQPCGHATSDFSAMLVDQDKAK